MLRQHCYHLRPLHRSYEKEIYCLKNNNDLKECSAVTIFVNLSFQVIHRLNK